MVKLKYNDAKETYSIKGLTYEHLALISAWAGNTLLGSGEYGTEAFDICCLLESEGVVPCDIDFAVDNEGYCEIRV